MVVLRAVFCATTSDVGLLVVLLMVSLNLSHRYNSVFFSSLATNSYNVLWATPDFAQGGAYNTKAFPGDDMCDVPQIHREAAKWTRLENAACIRTYADDLLSQYRNVILVVSNSTTANNSLFNIFGYDNGMQKALREGSSRDPYEWICDDDHLGDKIDLGPTIDLSFSVGAHPCYAEVSKLEAVADQWSVSGLAVQYCLAEPVTETCTLTFSLDIAIVVMVFNVVKILCMCYVAFLIRDRPLITVGDAVESFLKVVDETSKGMCLLTQKNVVFAWDQSSWEVNGGQRRDLNQDPVEFRMTRHKWSNAPSSGRWAIVSFL